MCCCGWELPLLHRERWRQKGVKMLDVHSCCFLKEALYHTLNHVSQDAAVVASPLHMPSIICVTTGHLCWSRNSPWTCLADGPPCLLLIDSWDRPKMVHMFSLCLIPNAYQGSVTRLFLLPSLQGPSAAAWQKANERKDLKVSERKTSKEDGRERLRFRKAVLCFEVLFRCAMGFMVGRAHWRAFSLTQRAFYLCRLLTDLV